MRAQPLITPMHRGRLPACSCRHPLPGVDGPERPSGRTALPSGVTPSTIMSPAPSHPGPRTEIRPGARAHAPTPSAATAPVKRSALGPAGRPRRGDRAPPPALNQAITGRSRDPQQRQHGSRACRVVPAQIRSSAPGDSARAADTTRSQSSQRRLSPARGCPCRLRVHERPQFSDREGHLSPRNGATISRVSALATTGTNSKVTS
jgi:hypothetical protein